MHKQLPTWQLIQRSLLQEIEVMLLYVLDSKGSSPGRQGFFMAVNVKGEMSGSLGGGIMEHKFIEMAKSKIIEGVEEVSVHYQFHDKEAIKNQSGMICSGEQTILLYKLKQGDINVISLLIQSLEENKNGTLQLSPGGIFFSENMPVVDFSLEFTTEGDFIYREKTGFKSRLYIIGGGHCALAFSRLMYSMDFYICLFDERMGLNTIDQNHYVHEIILVDNYSALSPMIPSGKNIYVVIMTVGYRTDEAALRALLGKDFKYLGMLGSETKIRKLFMDMKAEGIEDRFLNSVHAPIGIPIKSQATEEIAVSIAAEIIQEKNRELQ
ncbi:MAG: XdhC family protein [Ferruginibacter sp.]